MKKNKCTFTWHVQIKRKGHNVKLAEKKNMNTMSWQKKKKERKKKTIRDATFFLILNER